MGLHEVEKMVTELLDIQRTPLFPRIEFEYTGNGPLAKGAQLRSNLYIPTNNASYQAWGMDITAIDEVSIQIRMLDPMGNYSRPLFIQLFAVKKVETN